MSDNNNDIVSVYLLKFALQGGFSFSTSHQLSIAFLMGESCEVSVIFSVAHPVYMVKIIINTRDETGFNTHHLRRETGIICQLYITGRQGFI